jgi:hypothetical protein
MAKAGRLEGPRPETGAMIETYAQPWAYQI